MMKTADSALQSKRTSPHKAGLGELFNAFVEQAESTSLLRCALENSF